MLRVCKDAQSLYFQLAYKLSCPIDSTMMLEITGAEVLDYEIKLPEKAGLPSLHSTVKCTLVTLDSNKVSKPQCEAKSAVDWHHFTATLVLVFLD